MIWAIWTQKKIAHGIFFQKLTKIFKEGSASARRPAVMQAAAPPDPND
jgi:hypothetical protein